MGRGQILSGGPGGEYQVKLILHRSRVTATIARLAAEIAQLAVQIAGYDAKVLTATMDLSILNSELIILKARSPVDKDAVAAKVQAIEDKEDERAAIERERDVLRLRSTAATKRKKYLEDNTPADPTLTAWCADLTETLTGTVGTIEIPGERGLVNIYPGYDGTAVYDPATDGQLQPSIAGDPAGVFYDLAMKPGWQKWRPTFRYGTITAKTGDTCNVTLDAALSSQQSLNVNQTTTLSGVAIRYMSCNGAAFSVGDAVIVEFDEQDWTKPLVIGFKSNPKPCGEYAVIRISMEEISTDPTLADAVTVWNVEEGNTAVIAGVTFPCAWTDAAFQAWYTSKTKVGSQSLYDTVHISDISGRDEWDTTFGLVSHIGAEQTVASVWPPDASLTDVGIYTWPGHPGTGGGTVYDVVFDIKAYRPPTSGAIDAIVLPVSRCFRSRFNPAFKGGIRTRLECHEYYYYWSATGYSMDYYLNHTWARTWTFVSPWGVMDTHVSARSEVGLDVSGAAVLDNGIPNQRQATNVGWTAAKNYHRARPWVTQGIRGSVSDKSVVHCAHIAYCPVDYAATVTGGVYSGEAWSYNYARITVVHAHALWRGDAADGKSYDWRIIPRNNGLETAITAAVEQAYTINTLQEHEIRTTDATIEIVK